MLAAYVSETQRLLNDRNGQFFDLPTMHDYINRSRRRIAGVSGCLRAQIDNGILTHNGQEQYRLKDWVSVVQGVMPGAGEILYVRSLSIAIGHGPGAWRPKWRQVASFTDFDARFRIWNRTFVGMISEPGWWCQLGSGMAGIIYLAPIPSLEAPLSVDLQIIPAPLLDDEDPEPLPYPWNDAVAFWAATMCLMQQQRREDAQAMTTLFNYMLPEAAAVVCPQLIQTNYGPGHIRSA
jgi:hypothetical protein